MRLWTWQSPQFSLLEGRIDPTKSQYVETVPNYLEKRQELYRRLGTDDQIIWCSSSSEHMLTTIEEVEWALEVPDSEIVALLDEWVWCRILKLNPHVPHDLENKWFYDALDQFPDGGDTDARKQYCDQMRAAFWEQKLPTNSDPWTRLFVATIRDEPLTALIRHPIKNEWVKTRQTKRKVYR